MLWRGANPAPVPTSYEKRGCRYRAGRLFDGAVTGHPTIRRTPSANRAPEITITKKIKAPFSRRRPLGH